MLIHCHVAGKRITTLYDLGCDLIQEEGVSDFADKLGSAPLSPSCDLLFLPNKKGWCPYNHCRRGDSAPCRLHRWRQDAALMLMLTNSWFICRMSSRLQPLSTSVCGCKVLGTYHGLLHSKPLLLLMLQNAYGDWLQIFVNSFAIAGVFLLESREELIHILSALHLAALVWAKKVEPYLIKTWEGLPCAQFELTHKSSIVARIAHFLSSETSKLKLRWSSEVQERFSKWLLRWCDRKVRQEGCCNGENCGEIVRCKQG